MAESKSERAYRILRERIDTGQYGPGFRLALAPLAREFEMSVVPVREAIRRLEAEQLVTFERNIGAQVSLVKETEYLHTMQTLALVEGAATALSAPEITTAQIARARVINQQMRKTLDAFEPQRFTELNLEFHSVLFESCPNPHILDLVQRGWNRLKVLRHSSFTFVPGRAAESVAEHDEILNLLEKNASALDIELAARAHRTRTLDAVLAYTDHQKNSQAGHSPSA